MWVWESRLEKRTIVSGKAMKSSPLLEPFGDSEFWGFSLFENIYRLGAMMFQT